MHSLTACAQKALLSLYVGPLTVSLDTGVPAYSAAPVNATIFANATITSARGDIQLTLRSSSVTSAGGTANASIALSDNERRALINQVYAAASFSPLTLKFGATSIAITMICMSSSHSWACALNECAVLQTRTRQTAMRRVGCRQPTTSTSTFTAALTARCRALLVCMQYLARNHTPTKYRTVNTTPCGANASYYTIINECIPHSLTALPAFIAAISYTPTSPGGTIGTVEQLEALRYKYIITGPLIITVNDATEYDFTALYDIAQIYGLNGPQMQSMSWMLSLMHRAACHHQQQHDVAAIVSADSHGYQLQQGSLCAERQAVCCRCERCVT